MGKPTVVAQCALALLVVRADDVRLDLDVGLVHAWLLLVARVVVVVIDHLVRVAIGAVGVVHLGVRRCKVAKRLLLLGDILNL